MKRSQWPRWGAFNLFVLGAACQPSSLTLGTSSGTLSETTALVRGVPELGVEPVGGLYGFNATLGDYFLFCSGTLVAPRWVLTAAHCLEVIERPGRGSLPYYFTVEANVSKSQFGGLNSVHSARVLRAIEHPDSSSSDFGLHNDIGLIELAEEITTVEPMALALNTEEHFGGPANVVGYGSQGPWEISVGVGLRRRDDAYRVLQFDTQLPKYLSLERSNKGSTCSGDSGGAVTVMVDGTEKILGVNAHLNSAGDVQGDRCVDEPVFFASSVELYLEWIESYISTTSDCNGYNFCSCSAACGENGACDESQCEVSDCDAATECLEECGLYDEVCRYTCYQSMPERMFEQKRLQSMCGWGCSEDDTCTAEHCEAIARCGENWKSPRPKMDSLLTCLGPERSSGLKLKFCRNMYGHPARIEILDYLLLWAGDSCADEGYGDCLQNTVFEAMLNFPPRPNLVGCDMVESGCDPGRACQVDPWFGTACWQSQEKSENQACQADSLIPECADGMDCIEGVCTARCRRDEECDEENVCVLNEEQDFGRCQIPPEEKNSSVVESETEDIISELDGFACSAGGASGFLLLLLPWPLAWRRRRVVKVRRS